MEDVARGFEAVGVAMIILGLKVLVAADIIETITVDPSLESIGVLGSSSRSGSH